VIASVIETCKLIGVEPYAYPSFGLALWRATMLEASILRKRLLTVGRKPALQRIAHLLCEQLARRETVGINGATIPLTQIDLAHAAGLSIVHLNQTFQELRRLNILSKERRTIKVVTENASSVWQCSTATI
jgi:CRP-like cAMP-binding protein